MKRYKISVLFDGLFAGFCLFLIFFIIFSSFSGRNVSLVCSGILGFCFFILTAFLLSKRFDKKTLILSEQPKKQNLMFYLCLYPSDKTFIKLYGILGENLVKTPKGLFLASENAYVLPCFSFDGIKKSDIAKAYKRVNGKKTYILTDSVTPEITSFCAQFGNFTVYSENEVYAMFKKADMLIDETSLPTVKKQKFSVNVVINRVFKRKHALKYFGFGLTFMLFSFLVPFKLYYVIVGTIMLLLSLSCVLMPKTQPEKRFWEN